MRKALRTLAALSLLTCWALTGRRETWCARAWRLRHRPFWRAWVAVWDAVFKAVEDRHCERSSRRWN